MKTKTTLTGLLGLAILIAPVAGNGQITSQGGGYLLRIKHTKGDKASYKGTVNTTMATGNKPQTMTMNMTMSQLVKSVANGVATIDVTTSMTGGPMGNQKPTTVTMKMDNRGKMIGGAAGQMPSQYGLPEGPVRIGQTWTMDQDMSSAMPGMKVKATYKLLAIKNMNGRQIAEIQATSTTTGGQMSGTGSGTVYLRVADGSMQSMNMKMNFKMSQGQQTMNISTNIVMNRTN